MPSSNEIRNVEFAVTKNGYSRNEVDDLLDAIEADYVKFESEIARLRATVANLNKQIEDAKSSQNSIQTVLVRAQQLADDIVAKANENAEQIMADCAANAEAANNKARAEVEAILRDGEEKRRVVQEEIERLKNESLATSEAMITSAKDSVARQQIQFEAIKKEVSDFKEIIRKAYKEHLELLAAIPDEVSGDPTMAAGAIEQIILQARAAAFAEKVNETEVEENEPQETDEVEEVEEIEASVDAEPVVSLFEEVEAEQIEALADEVEPEEIEEEQQGGFKVTIPVEYVIPEEDDDEEDEDDDEPENKRGFGTSKFFRRRG